MEGGENMKALGVVRKIDQLGRIVIPKEVRKAKGWDEGHSMEMFMDGDKLVLQSFDDARKQAEIIDRLQNLPNIKDEKVFRSEVAYLVGYLKGVK